VSDKPVDSLVAYIDFLVLGCSAWLDGGGLWESGLSTVDYADSHWLKRFVATPMKKSDFLAGIMISRLAFMVPEVLILLLFSRIASGW